MRSAHHGKEEVSQKAPEAESRWQLILAVGAEGGSIELHGRPLGKTWTFCRTLGDQTPLLLGESEIRHSSSVTGTWVDGLALLDRYPWAERGCPDFCVIGPYFPREGCHGHQERDCR
jgi:hypothetical protein